MTAAVMTNYGRRWMASVAFRGAHPDATTDGDVGLAVNGAAVPSCWVLLLNTAYLFTGTGGFPNKDHKTVALMLAQYPGCVIAPAAYSNGFIERNRVRWTTTEDDVGDLARISFVAGQEPLLTVVSTMNNIAGWALVQDNLGAAGTKVLAIYGFSNGTIPTALASEQIRLTAGEGTLL